MLCVYLEVTAHVCGKFITDCYLVGHSHSLWVTWVISQLQQIEMNKKVHWTEKLKVKIMKCKITNLS